LSQSYKKEKLRVLHAPIIALYQPYLFNKGLKELGCKADYMVHNFQNEDKWLARGVDYNLKLDMTQGLQIEKTIELDFFNYAIENYDVFHFHSGYGLLSHNYSLWDRLSELEYLKKNGKKIVMHWWGCDIRTEDVDIVNKWSACNVCLDSIRQGCKSHEKTEMIKKAFRFVDVHLSNGDIVASYDNVKWFDNAIDCEEFKPLKLDDIPKKYHLKQDNKIKIFHSFGNSTIRGDVKGSFEIKEAVEKLQSEGYNVEFIFFDRVPNTEIKYYQAQADIVVDQLKCGWHGSAGMECLSMGKPVITYIRPEVEQIIQHEHPLINANINTIYEVLKDLLDNMDKTLQIGRESRKYALKYHDYKVVSKKLLDIYESI